MSRTIREAKPADMPEITQVMEAAKKIMRFSGNSYNGKTAIQMSMDFFDFWQIICLDNFFFIYLHHTLFT